MHFRTLSTSCIHAAYQEASLYFSVSVFTSLHPTQQAHTKSSTTTACQAQQRFWKVEAGHSLNVLLLRRFLVLACAFAAHPLRAAHLDARSTQ